MLSFSKPDERTRQLHERAGSTAASVMMFLLATIACVFMFGYKDMKTGEILMCPIFIVGIYSLATGKRIRLMVRDEYTRKTDIRKKGLKSLLWFSAIMFVSFFITDWLSPIDQPKTFKYHIVHSIGMGVWMGAFFYWMYFRKVKKKENKSND
jgi:hypothetical protein